MDKTEEKRLEERKDKFGISERDAREVHKKMRIKHPEFPIKKWDELTKKTNN